MHVECAPANPLSSLSLSLNWISQVPLKKKPIIISIAPLSFQLLLLLHVLYVLSLPKKFQSFKMARRFFLNAKPEKTQSDEGQFSKILWDWIIFSEQETVTMFPDGLQEKDVPTLYLHPELPMQTFKNPKVALSSKRLSGTKHVQVKHFPSVPPFL